MAKVTVTLDIPGWTREDLVRAVVDLDRADAGEGNEVHPAYVRAFDVVGAVWAGDLGVDHTISVDTIED